MKRAKLILLTVQMGLLLMKVAEPWTRIEGLPWGHVFWPVYIIAGVPTALLVSVLTMMWCQGATWKEIWLNNAPSCKRVVQRTADPAIA